MGLALSFAPAVKYTLSIMSSYPSAIAAGDLTGDQIVDLVTVNDGSNDLSLFAGTGMGTFNAAVSVPIGGSLLPSMLVLRDFDHDNRLDVAVVSTQNDLLIVMLNRGANGFMQAAYALPANSAAYSLASADVTGDGFDDLVVSSYGLSTVTTYRNFGNGTFVLVGATTVGSGPY